MSTRPNQRARYWFHIPSGRTAADRSRPPSWALNPASDTVMVSLPKFVPKFLNPTITRLSLEFLPGLSTRILRIRSARVTVATDCCASGVRWSGGRIFHLPL